MSDTAAARQSTAQPEPRRESAQQDTAQHDTAQQDMARHDTARHDTAGPDAAQRSDIPVASAQSNATRRGGWRLNSIGRGRQASAARGGPAARPAEMSWMILLLAALTALYLAFALRYAGADALSLAGSDGFSLSQIDLPVLGAVAGALLALAILAQIRWASGIVLILLASFAAQLGWGLWAGPEPFADAGMLWQETQSFAAALQAGEFDEATLYGSRAPTFVILFGVVGAVTSVDDITAMRAVSAGLWTLQTFLVWRIAREGAELRDRAFAAAAVIGLAPTVLVYGGLPSVDALFGVFILSAIYVILTHRTRGLARSAALSGFFAAAAFLTRPVGAAIGLGLLIVLALGLVRVGGLWRKAQMLGALLACPLGFALGVAPQAVLNFSVDSSFSITPGDAVGYQLLIGTNPAGAQGFSAEDLEAAGFTRADPALSLKDVDANARQIAWERIVADPARFVGFAVTEKMRRLWSSETELLERSLPPLSSGRAAIEETSVARSAALLIDAVFLAVLAAAALGAGRLAYRRGAVRDPTRWVLLITAFLSLAAAYSFFEARANHHLALTPLLALLAPLPFVRLPQTQRAAARPSTAVGAEPAERAEAETPEPTPIAARTPAMAESAAVPAAPTPPSAPRPIAIGDGVMEPSATAPARSEPPETDDRPMIERPVEERLAIVLRRMSKPPRSEPNGRS